MIEYVTGLLHTEEEHDGNDHGADPPDRLKGGKYFWRVRKADHYMVSTSNPERPEAASQPAAHLVHSGVRELFPLKNKDDPFS
jgi:hypothetical protein